MSDKNNSKALLTPTGVLSFPHLFVAKAPVPGADARFSMTLIFDEAAQKSAEYAALKKAVMECIAAEWGEAKAKDANFIKTLRLPFRKADEKSQYAGYNEGSFFISPWSKFKPGIVDARRNEILVPDDVFAGQLARATVVAFPFSTSGNKGVAFMLNNVQIVKKDMPRLDGRRAAADDFGAVDTDDDTTDTDDIPF